MVNSGIGACGDCRGDLCGDSAQIFRTKPAAGVAGIHAQREQQCMNDLFRKQTMQHLRKRQMADSSGNFAQLRNQSLTFELRKKMDAYGDFPPLSERPGSLGRDVEHGKAGDAVTGKEQIPPDTPVPPPLDMECHFRIDFDTAHPCGKIPLKMQADQCRIGVDDRVPKRFGEPQSAPGAAELWRGG